MSSQTPLPMQTSPDLQRLQAMESVRRQLLDRLNPLSRQLSEEALAGRCQLRIALGPQTAQLSCTHEADQARIWPSLQGLVRPTPQEQRMGPGDLCWLLEGASITSTPCDAS